MYDFGLGSYIGQGVRAILDQPKLQTLTFKTNNPRPSWFDGECFKTDEKALHHLHFAWSDDETSLRDLLAAKAAVASAMKTLSSGALNPFWHPMERFSREQRVFIWREIVSYAIHGSTYTHLYDLSRNPRAWFNPRKFDIQVARALLLVSSEFYVCFLFFSRRHSAWRCY